MGPLPRASGVLTRGYDRPVNHAPRFPVVLFDLDGTLIDSGPMILASMQHAVRSVTGRELAYEELAATVGGQGLVAQMEALDPDRVDELVEAYREHNDPLHETLEAFAGMIEVVPQLRADGRRLGIVTAKRHRTVALAIERFPWLEAQFEVVVTNEDTTRHKPDPAPVFAALERLEAEPASAAYVGDSPFDIDAAKAAGVFAVAVGWGGIHADDALASHGPDAFVHSPAELLDVL